MKQFVLTTCIMFFAISFLAYPGDKPKGDAPVAIIMKAIKDVNFKKANGSWSAAKVGVALSSNDEIKTGDKSLALIKFSDNSILRVRENSNLKIYADKNRGDLSKNTYIDNGKVGFQVTKQQNEEFKFTTPTMVASIRGTSGELEVNQDSTLLIVGEGTIDIKALKGLMGSETVTGGQHIVVDKDGNIILYQNTDKEKSELDNNGKNNVKRLVIKTNLGDLVIEYLGEN
jgi:hypothetical protein